MKTAMHFFFWFLVMLVVNPFWWKAHVPLPFAHFYSIDDLMICISVSHAPSFNDKLSLAVLSQCQPGCLLVWDASFGLTLRTAHLSCLLKQTY